MPVHFNKEKPGTPAHKKALAEHRATMSSSGRNMEREEMRGRKTADRRKTSRKRSKSQMGQKMMSGVAQGVTKGFLQKQGLY